MEYGGRYIKWGFEVVDDEQIVPLGESQSQSFEAWEGQLPIRRRHFNKLKKLLLLLYEFLLIKFRSTSNRINE